MPHTNNSEFLKIIMDMEQDRNKLFMSVRQRENSALTGKISLYLLEYGMAVLVVGIFSPLLISFLIGPRQWLGYMFIFFLLLIFIWEMLFLLCNFLNYKEKIKSFIFSPFYKSFQTSFNISLVIIEIYLPKLIELSELSLESALIELRSQHTKLEGNICLFAGVVKNFGVILTVLVLSAIIFKKSDTVRVYTQIFSIDVEEPYFIAAIVIGLLITSTIAYQHLARWNDVIALTKMALKRKRGLQQGPDGSGVPRGYQ